MTIAVLLWAGSLFILSGQLIALAWILNVVAGVPKIAGCILGGVVVTAYSAAGGLLSAAWVNVLQLTVKLAGLVTATVFALEAIGGIAMLQGLKPTTDYWNFTHSNASGVSYVAVLAPAFLVSPGLLQKIFGARDERAVRVGVGLNALALLMYAIVPVLLGMVARARFPDLSSPELALPTLLLHGLPQAIGILGLAAVFSAELSAADAVLFMLTTSVTRDFYTSVVAKNADDRKILRVSRLTAISLGMTAVILAMVAESVIGALTIFYTLLGVAVFAPVLAGLFVPAAAARDALLSIAAGVATVLILQLWPAFTVPWLTPAAAGIIASMASLFAGVAFGRRNAGRHGLR